MALLIMILRKMAKNKWLELSLLFGLIFTVALISSMPIYTSAILQRMFTQDLKNLQDDQNIYPGGFSYTVTLPGDVTAEQKKNKFLATDQFLKQQENKFGMPVQLFKMQRIAFNTILKPSDPTKDDPKNNIYIDIRAMTGLEDHIRLVDGRLPAKTQVNGVYEVLVTDNLLIKKNMVIGTEFIGSNSPLGQEKARPFHMKIVGVMAQKDNQDLYWNDSIDAYDSSFMMDYDLFANDFVDSSQQGVVSSDWYYALDYSKLKLADIPTFLAAFNLTNNFFQGHHGSYVKKVPTVEIIYKYFAKEKLLRIILFSINVPVMILLAFYLYMVSNLIMDRQKTEIAVLRSRGASRLQILFGYLIEGIVLGGIAYLIGPFVGLEFTKILGGANGFLEFVQRAALDAELSRQAYQYALIAILCSVLMTIIPAFLATRSSIVNQKRQSAREATQSFWHKFYIDIILLGIAIYGLQSYKRRMHDLLTLGLSSADFNVDPLLFVIPSIFLLGSGLLTLRLYPWIIRLIYWLGKRWWPSSLYMILLQVGRSAIKYQFIMVFLILTLATGLFSASAARTINKNMEDKINYLNGADITFKLNWSDEAPLSPVLRSSSQSIPLIAGDKHIQYSEPPFTPYTELPGVESIAKVFTEENAYIQENGSSDHLITRLMGIDTDEFGRVAWMRDKLLDHHINDYLNLIAGDPSAVLISKSIADSLNIKVGDQINIGWDGVSGAVFTVYGIINYWPSWNPNPVSVVSDNKVTVQLPRLIVGNLSYIQDNLELKPYDVWLKLKQNASLNSLYQAIEKKHLPVTSLSDSRQELIKSKNEPFHLAVNGVLTLGFIISIMISFLGFLLYWILSLSGRTLQYGILRAMGISLRQLIGMLFIEQLLTSGAAILIGLITGNLTCKLFVPLFQLSFNTSTQVPPFEVIFNQMDNIRLYIIITIMLLLALFILGVMLSKIKIHQAVKLGED